MKKKLFFFLVFILLLVSCQNFRRDGFTRIDPGIYMKMLRFGEGEKAAEKGDYISLQLEYLTSGDSLFYRGMKKFRNGSGDIQPGLNQVFTHLHEGDSISLILGVKKFFRLTLKRDIPPFLEEEPFLKMNFRIIKIQNREEYEQEKKIFLSWARELEKTEQDLIRDYILDNQLDMSPTPTGLYFMKLENGKGPEVRKGKHISIQYEGRDLNGKILDSTIKSGQALDFVYGHEFILIPGLEEAVGRMREGDHALAVLSSDQAFGRSGSSTGYIPPFTSLVYEIVIIKVE